MLGWAGDQELTMVGSRGGLSTPLATGSQDSINLIICPTYTCRGSPGREGHWGGKNWASPGPEWSSQWFQFHFEAPGS